MIMLVFHDDSHYCDRITDDWSAYSRMNVSFTVVEWRNGSANGLFNLLMTGEDFFTGVKQRAIQGIWDVRTIQQKADNTKALGQAAGVPSSAQAKGSAQGIHVGGSNGVGVMVQGNTVHAPIVHKFPIPTISAKEAFEEKLKIEQGKMEIEAEYRNFLQKAKEMLQMGKDKK